VLTLEAHDGRGTWRCGPLVPLAESARPPPLGFGGGGAVARGVPDGKSRGMTVLHCQHSNWIWPRGTFCTALQRVHFTGRMPAGAGGRPGFWQMMMITPRMPRSPPSAKPLPAGRRPARSRARTRGPAAARGRTARDRRAVERSPHRWPDTVARVPCSADHRWQARYHGYADPPAQPRHIPDRTPKDSNGLPPFGSW